MSNVTLKHIPVRNWAALTVRSSSLRFVSAAENHTASTPKRAGQNPESISQEATYHGTLERTS